MINDTKYQVFGIISAVVSLGTESQLNRTETIKKLRTGFDKTSKMKQLLSLQSLTSAFRCLTLKCIKNQLCKNNISFSETILDAVSFRKSTRLNQTKTIRILRKHFYKTSKMKQLLLLQLLTSDFQQLTLYYFEWAL